VKAAALLIFALSHTGHWLSGTNATVKIAWAAQAPVAPATVVWELRFDGATVSSGRTLLPDAKRAIEIAVAAPTVRVRTTVQWRYHVSPADGGADIEAGSLPVWIYPPDLIDDYSRQFAQRGVVLFDKSESLGRILKQARIPCTRVDDLSRLATLKADVVLIGEDMIDDTVFAQGPLQALARNGSQVLLLRQSRPRMLMNYRLSERNISPSFAWRNDHPLLDGFDADELAALLGGQKRALAIQLPADEPALEIGYWSAEMPGNDPGPIDALLVTKRCGDGRVVMCQLPMGNISDDPLSQIFLNNMLNYLATRPEPTPRPSERLSPITVSAPQAPSIHLSPGDQP